MQVGVKNPAPQGANTCVTSAAGAINPSLPMAVQKALERMGHGQEQLQHPPTFNPFQGPQQTLFASSDFDRGGHPPLFTARDMETTALQPYRVKEEEYKLMAALPSEHFRIAKSPVNLAMLRQAMWHHPNREYVEYLTQGFTKGFSFQYSGDNKPFTLPNLASVKLAPAKISENILEEIRAGRMSSGCTIHLTRS